MEKLIDKHAVRELVGFSDSTIWRLMRVGEFPLSVRIGGRVRWRASEIEAYIANLPTSKLKPPPVKAAKSSEASSAAS